MDQKVDKYIYSAFPRAVEIPDSMERRLSVCYDRVRQDCQQENSLIQKTAQKSTEFGKNGLIQDTRHKTQDTRHNEKRRENDGYKEQRKSAPPAYRVFISSSTLKKENDTSIDE